MTRIAATDPGTRRTRRHQLLLFSGVASAALVGFALWLSGGSDAPVVPASGIDAELAGPDTAEDSWMRRSETRIGTLEASLRELESANRQILADNEELQKQLAGQAADARTVIDRQAAVIDELRRSMTRPDPGMPPAEGWFANGNRATGPGTVTGPATAEPGTLAPAPLIREFDLETDAPIAPEDKDKPEARVHPVDGRLPAGSHAEAVVIAGVDASAGVSSQGDPRPVLLRFTGPAWSAAENGAALRVDIRGCTVTGAAHGDLSSEKVYVRLRTLTCTGPAPGTVIETEVAGFVAGAGKTGIRGPVVSREGDLIEKAFLAGLVSGAGDSATALLRPGPDVTANVGDIGRAGLGAGAASAGRKVADYLIRRAEQYQPVIQLTAGTRVTVVFLEGADLAGAGMKSQETQS